MTRSMKVVLAVAVIVAATAAVSGPQQMKRMHAVSGADTLQVQLATEAIVPQVNVSLVHDPERYKIIFDVTNGSSATNAIALFGAEPFGPPYGTVDPAQWWALYGFDGRDSVVVWACMDTLTAEPTKWTDRGPSPYMMQPGETRQFVLYPGNVPPQVRFYAQGFDTVPDMNDPQRTLFAYGWQGQVTLNVTAVPTDKRPQLLELGQPAPNPSRGFVSIAFALPKEADVQLAVYDVAGSLVRRLVAGRRPAGTHIATWDGRDDRGRARSTGVYFARLNVEGKVVGVKRVVVVH